MTVEQEGLVVPPHSPCPGTPPDHLSREAADPRGGEAARKQRMGAALVLSVAVLYVGSGVAIQVLFEELEFEKPFFFSYVAVSLCSVHLLQYFYLRGRRSWRRRESRNYRQLEQLDSVEQTQVSILNEPWLLVRPALLLSPAYFCLNYTYFLSLDLTSVSETMILSASTGVWTLLFSRLLLKERVTQTKLLTVAVSIFGMGLVTYSSRTAAAPPPPPPAMQPGSAAADGVPGSGAARGEAGGDDMDEGGAGDLLALMSASASGIYVVLLRACVPDEDSVHMPSLFGMIGLVSAVCFAPLFLLFHYSGVEEFELPPTRGALLAVAINALLSTVLPDMLLALAVVMTSPLLATLGLSTMIPLSVVADFLRGLANLTPMFFMGTVMVFVGFQLENWAETGDAGAAKAETR